MKRTSFTQLKALIPRALKHYNIASGVHAAQVVNRWPELAHKVLKLQDKNATRARYLKNGVLTIEVSNSAISQAVQLAKLPLIEALNQDFDSPRVRDIRCVQG